MKYLHRGCCRSCLMNRWFRPNDYCQWTLNNRHFLPYPLTLIMQFFLNGFKVNTAHITSILGYYINSQITKFRQQLMITKLSDVPVTNSLTINWPTYKIFSVQTTTSRIFQQSNSKLVKSLDINVIFLDLFHNIFKHQTLWHFKNVNLDFGCKSTGIVYASIKQSHFK